MKRIVVLLCIVFTFALVLNLWSGEIDKKKTIASDKKFTYTYDDLEDYLNILRISQPMIDQPDIDILEIAKDKNSIQRISDVALRALYCSEIADKIEKDKANDLELKVKTAQFVKFLMLDKTIEENGITTEDINIEYEKLSNGMYEPEKIKVAVIYKFLPDTDDEQKSIFESLKKLKASPDFDEKFSEYAKNYSNLPNAVEGGILDYFPRGTYGKTIEGVVFNMKKGEISDIIKTQRGYYIFKCIDIIGEGKPPLSTFIKGIKLKIAMEKYRPMVDEKIKSILAEKKAEVISEIPANPDGKLVLVKAGDETITSSTLTKYLNAKNNRSKYTIAQIKEIAKNFGDAMIIIQEAQTLLNEPEYKRKYQIFLNDYFFNKYFNLSIADKINITEEECREQYEKNITIYNAVGNRKIGYLFFKQTQGGANPGKEFFKSVYRLEKSARQFYDGLKTSVDKNFTEESKKYCEKNKNVKYEETDFINTLPGDWGVDKIDLLKYSKNELLPFMVSKNGYYVAAVIETADQILPFSSVKGRIFSTIYESQRNIYYENLKKQMLEKYNFKKVN